MTTSSSNTPPVCDYEGSTYQETFWDKGGRAYEDAAEAIAIQRLLPPGGKLLLEVGAGAGRNTARYPKMDQIVLLDYSLTQLQQAQARLGRGSQYIYVAANVYHLPFVASAFDRATMIRVLHHLKDGPLALGEIRRVMQPGGLFILEFANKLNLKAIFRWLLGRQKWSPFSPEPVEFVELNFDFHPRTTRQWLADSGFEVERQLTVSHFRIGLLKRLVPHRLLVWFDSLAQLTGNWWQLSPSVFVRSRARGASTTVPLGVLFQCPKCGSTHLRSEPEALVCSGCQVEWPVRDGIYDFRM